jgi:fibronectin type 3 domain-containing protein
MLTRTPLALALGALVAAVLASVSAGKPPGGMPPGLERAIEAQERASAQLLSSPGIVGTGVGLNRAGNPVIRVYTDRPDNAHVPESLEGVPVERVATGIIQARAPTDRFPRPVPIGVSSGYETTATGTLGARVTDGTNVYALSNNHVYAGINTATIGGGVIQPGSVDGGSDPADRIGTLHAFHPIDFSAGASNTLDAAIALTAAANVSTSTPADGYGTPSPVTAQAFIGQGVQKYGRTTGLQLGTVAELNVSVDVCYLFIPPSLCLQEARFVNQVSVTPDAFSAGGDSGSLIVTQGGNQPVALLFAGGEGRTLGNPIDLVLQRFGVTVDGAVPPDGVPTAPAAPAAVAGAGSVTVSWGPPSWDGGSPITEYRVYRGTSPGSETFLESAGTATSFIDTGVTNGVTYSYRVSATSANGEGPLSSSVSATPTDLVAPQEPLPVLDSFDRSNESPLSDGGRWGNGVNGSAETGLHVSSNALACSRTTTCTAWRSNAQYGPNAESWARIATWPGDGNALRLYVRLQSPGSSAVDGYMAVANLASGTDQIVLYRITNSGLTSLITVGQDLAVGDVLLLRAKGSALETWLSRGGSWSRIALVTDTTYAGAGYVGVGLRGTTGRLDDFGGRTLGQAPPGAPTGLAAAAGDDTVSLSWVAPALDGGSPVTEYRVRRGTSPGSETFLASAGAATSFVDSTAANGITYSYRVSAVNAAGEGTLSAGATATPAALVAPLEPLPLVDSFDRPNESPLSDGGKWGNGVNGSAETGLQVSSNLLACTKSTTCTAWRQDTQYGPDDEVAVRIATLPGANNQIRLHARIQQPGTAAYDGYMLRAVPLSGVDALNIDRVDNGTIVTIASAASELAAGDVLLLRTRGTTIEAWQRSGTSWSRVVTVADATYAAAGYAGVGVRGTTGRLDDFSARDDGSPPPPPEPPSTPTSLAAQNLNGLVRLTWQPPSDDGGSEITGYRIYRGTTSATKTLLATVGAATSYDDLAVTNETTYYYDVSAVNAVGEGARSAEASATPTDLVLPAEPQPTLDSFDRANESPLSFGGRWGNGIVGSAERSLKVASNRLAGTKSSTTTAWWTPQQHGPDTESWATVTTLPGSGNGFRLYVRVQSPGSSAADGYFLLVTQASGADTFTLYRMTNAALTVLATGSREIAAGDLLLVRAQGSSLEGWVRSGGVWTRVVRATDSTYPGAGHVGVGIRGKTGRLDDFGGR